MFKVIVMPRVEREFTKLSGDLRQKFYDEFKKLEIDPFGHPRLKRLKILNLVIASALAGGEFYLLYF